MSRSRVEEPWLTRALTHNEIESLTEDQQINYARYMSQGAASDVEQEPEPEPEYEAEDYNDDDDQDDDCYSPEYYPSSPITPGGAALPITSSLAISPARPNSPVEADLFELPLPVFAPGTGPSWNRTAGAGAGACVEGEEDEQMRRAIALSLAEMGGGPPTSHPILPPTHRTHPQEQCQNEFKDGQPEQEQGRRHQTFTPWTFLPCSSRHSFIHSFFKQHASYRANLTATRLRISGLASAPALAGWRPGIPLSPLWELRARLQEREEWELFEFAKSVAGEVQPHSLFRVGGEFSGVVRDRAARFVEARRRLRRVQERAWEFVPRAVRYLRDTQARAEWCATRDVEPLLALAKTGNMDALAIAQEAAGTGLMAGTVSYWDFWGGITACWAEEGDEMDDDGMDDDLDFDPDHAEEDGHAQMQGGHDSVMGDTEEVDGIKAEPNQDIPNAEADDDLYGEPESVAKKPSQASTADPWSKPGPWTNMPTSLRSGGVSQLTMGESPASEAWFDAPAEQPWTSTAAAENWNEYQPGDTTSDNTEQPRYRVESFSRRLGRSSRSIVHPVDRPLPPRTEASAASSGIANVLRKKQDRASKSAREQLEERKIVMQAGDAESARQIAMMALASMNENLIEVSAGIPMKPPERVEAFVEEADSVAAQGDGNETTEEVSKIGDIEVGDEQASVKADTGFATLAGEDVAENNGDATAEADENRVAGDKLGLLAHSNNELPREDGGREPE